jgi:hypothetical protein
MTTLEKVYEAVGVPCYVCVAPIDREFVEVEAQQKGEHRNGRQRVGYPKLVRFEPAFADSFAEADG